MSYSINNTNLLYYCVQLATWPFQLSVKIVDLHNTLPYINYTVKCAYFVKIGMYSLKVTRVSLGLSTNLFLQAC